MIRSHPNCFLCFALSASFWGLCSVGPCLSEIFSIILVLWWSRQRTQNWYCSVLIAIFENLPIFSICFFLPEFSVYRPLVAIHFAIAISMCLERRLGTHILILNLHGIQLFPIFYLCSWTILVSVFLAKCNFCCFSFQSNHFIVLCLFLDSCYLAE